MQPEPHTQPRIHIAVDFKSTRKRLQNHFMFVCCSLDGYSFLNKTLEWAGISTDFAVWSELAQDRPAWRALILATAEYPPPPPPP